MKENYKAWEVNVEDFYKLKDELERYRFLINFAVLAPSSYNAQPWKFEITEKGIFLFVDQSRFTPKGDPIGRQMYLGLGCALENLLIAAEYYNYRANVKYFPEDFGNGAAVWVRLEKVPEKIHGKNHPIFYISKRASNRNEYFPRLPPDTFLVAIGGVAASFGVKLALITDKDKRVLLGKLARRATEEAMSKRDFREELSHFIKSNITKSTIGMPGFGMGFPTVPSLFASFMLKK